MYHDPCNPNDSPIVLVSHPILLKSVRNGELSMDALTRTKVDKLLVHILTSIVCPQYFDFPTYLIFY
jgi:predicted RNase H-like nuclease